MTALVLCDDCNGHGWRLGAACASCDGHGRIVPTAAADALLDVLGPHFGSKNTKLILDVLDDSRAELAAWLVETGMLRPTLYGLEPVKPSSPLVKPWEKDYIRPGTTRLVDVSELGPHGKRMYTVDAP